MKILANQDMHINANLRIDTGLESNQSKKERSPIFDKCPHKNNETQVIVDPDYTSDDAE